MTVSQPGARRLRWGVLMGGCCAGHDASAQKPVTCGRSQQDMCMSSWQVEKALPGGCDSQAGCVSACFSTVHSHQACTHMLLPAACDTDSCWLTPQATMSCEVCLRSLQAQLVVKQVKARGARVLRPCQGCQVELAGLLEVLFTCPPSLPCWRAAVRGGSGSEDSH